MADHAHNKRAEFARAGRPSRPIGVITRGTTNQNRLRRCDRWMANNPEIQRLLKHANDPLAIDLGYGASATTTVEWAQWLRRIRPDIDVLGLEIAPERIQPAQQGVRFGLGGFELAGHRPHLVRAFNVLRQYDVNQVHDAWHTVCSRLAPGGLFIEGTCDELGRRSTWITLDAHGPRTLTLAWDPLHTDYPSELAERLPKALIHRNVPGEKIHTLLQRLDRAWDHTVALAPFGPRQRWRETQRLVATELGIAAQRHRRSDNLFEVPWSLVAAEQDDSKP
ncbi:class I SAM-dependent methyltransferase [Corynebacterium pelargi]|uniref:Uncharacterized protein n=1 Tax=Corynebacterium pelargi TaxID=1471400 RepID=A0A410WBC7_9CORY|nr:class I SAM-dependent methyltransferase [Corynebacterium pelargi]QAU53252.1 hypothetical protein CPELA_10005 [Corynebacterium pelargi]GGG73756.1 methylase [Corynebacterium pelargi]